MSGPENISRRNFLKGATAVTIATATGGKEAFGQAPLESKVKNIETKAKELSQLALSAELKKVDTSKEGLIVDAATRQLQGEGNKDSISSPQIRKKMIDESIEKILKAEAAQQNALIGLSKGVSDFEKEIKTLNNKAPSQDERENLNSLYRYDIKAHIDTLENAEYSIRSFFESTPAFSRNRLDMIEKRKKIVRDIVNATEQFDPEKIFRK